MNIDLNRHKQFNDKVSADMYNCLELLSALGNGQQITQENVNLLKKIIKDIKIDKYESSENKMKSSIWYIKLCRIINNLLKEYENYGEEFKKILIDYYIQSNNMKEMNNIGFGWYYDMKFKKDTITLYSAGYGTASNWCEWLTSHYNKCNQIKEKGIQLIFHGCKEHINRGGEIRLKSLSKCLGVDLFKYMQLDKNGTANLYIINHAFVNFIEYGGSRISLQEYLSSVTYSLFDLNKSPNFCLDFSHPRNDKAQNYNNWSENFLTNVFISQAEFDEKKKAFGMKDDMLDYLILSCLRDEHINGSDRAISSRISPIADKEVIASDTLWKIEEYTSKIDINVLSEKCCHITLDKMEYYQLIFNYFKQYYERKSSTGQKSFYEVYDERLANEKSNVERNIINLKDENIKLLKRADIQPQDADEKNIQNKININEVLIGFYGLYKVFLDDLNLNQTNEKIQFILSFVDWKTEELPSTWSLHNIYTLKENKEDNLILNLYKILCKQAAFN